MKSWNESCHSQPAVAQMNKLTKKSFFSLGTGDSNQPTRNPSHNNQRGPISYEVFKEHWKQALNIFNKSLVNDDDIQMVKNNLTQMVDLLLEELNNLNNYLSLKQPASNRSESSNYGPLWDYLFRNNIFEVVFLWSLSYPEYLFDLKYEQLKYYENLVYQMQTNEQTNLLLHSQIHRPLFSLLNHCATHNSEPIEKLMISIMNQLCVCICKNANLLEIFFQQSQLGSSMSGSSSAPSFGTYEHHRDSFSSSSGNMATSSFASKFTKNKQYLQSPSSARFFIFSLLIPYIHKEGDLGKLGVFLLNMFQVI